MKLTYYYPFFPFYAFYLSYNAVNIESITDPMKRKIHIIQHRRWIPHYAEDGVRIILNSMLEVIFMTFFKEYVFKIIFQCVIKGSAGQIA